MRIFVPCLAVAILAGCTSPQLHRASIGRVGDGAVVLPDLAVQDRAEAPVKSDGPSAPTLARAWDPVTVCVPVDGVYAFPRYTRTQNWTDDTSRQRRGHVTPVTALELGGDEDWTRAGEAAAAGPLALAEALLLVPRMTIHKPWVRVRSLPASYWRTAPGVGVTQQAEVP